MKGFIKYTEIQQAKDLVNQINDCLGLPTGETITWDTPTDMCSLDDLSAYTQFWGYVIKVDTEQLTNCLTQQQVENIIQLPSNIGVCITNQVIN